MYVYIHIYILFPCKGSYVRILLVYRAALIFTACWCTVSRSAIFFFMFFFLGIYRVLQIYKTFRYSFYIGPFQVPPLFTGIF